MLSRLAALVLVGSGLRCLAVTPTVTISPSTSIRQGGVATVTVTIPCSSDCGGANFDVDGTYLGGANFNGQGSLTLLLVGKYGLGAHVLDVNYTPSSGAGVTVPVSFTVVDPPADSIAPTVTLSPTPVIVGQPVTVTESSGYSDESGTVLIYIDGQYLGPELYTGTQSLPLPPFSTAGVHTITGVYSGTPDYTPYTITVSVPVQAPGSPAVTSLSCTPSAVTPSEMVTCSVPLPAGATSPVAFTIAGEVWQTAIPDASGAAVVTGTLGTLPAGSYPIAYSYPGDGGIPGSSGSVTEFLQASAPTSGVEVYSFSILQADGNTTGYAPNGNVTAYSDSVNGTWSVGYDNLNRLTSTVQNLPGATASSFGCWQYDSFGNMQKSYSSSQAFAAPGTCQPATEATTSQTSFTYGSSTPNNQITTGTWRDSNGTFETGTPTYDASGNMTGDHQNTYLYDAEGHVCAMQGYGGIIGYVYDAEGHRVAKGTLPSMTCDPSALTVDTAYIIGASGNEMTELERGDFVHTNVYAAGELIATIKNDGPHFLLNDWLGTRRVQTDAIGSVELTCQSQPFGDQMSCSGIANDASTAAGNDASAHHFTGKERDAESGLDYFGARHYSSAMGRFMSPDPSQLYFADPSNPQSLNLYSYALNNPLRFIDPTGLTACFYGGKGDTPVVNGQGSDHDPTDYEDVADEDTCKANGGVSINANTFVQVTANSNDSVDVSSITLVNTLTYRQCSATQFKVTGVGPTQAPGNGAFTGQPPNNGQVAIKPQNFGIPYSNVAQRSAAQGGGVKAAISNTVIFPNYQTASTPRGIPQTPFGAPSGPYTPADAIGPSSVRDSPGNQIDVYRYDTRAHANASTRTTTPTIFVPNNSSGVGCPN